MAWHRVTRKYPAEPTTARNTERGDAYVSLLFLLDRKTEKGMEIRAMDVVLKVTERCNLACPYCYFFFGGDESHAIHPPTIPASTVDGLVEYIQRSAGPSSLKSVRIILHGGEPLLLKKQRFDEICDRLRSELGKLCDLSIAMQTNGVLLDEAWIDLFEKHRINVGVSMDGEPTTHDKTRITKKGRGTYQETRRGWELLKIAAANGRIEEPGLICVIDPTNDGRAAYEHFARDMRAKSFNFLLPDVNHDTPTLNREYVQGCTRYLTDVFLAWTAHADPSVNVRFITDSLYPLVDNEAMGSLCAHSTQGQSLIAVSSNGEIVPNDVLRGLAPEFRGKDITVFNADIAGTIASPAWLIVTNAESTLCDSCMECEWRNVCRGGSLQHRYSQTNGFANPSVFCEGLKSYFTVVAKSAIRAGFDIEKISQRLESSWSNAPMEAVSA